MENVEATNNEEIQNSRTIDGKQTLKRELNKYYDHNNN